MLKFHNNSFFKLNESLKCVLQKYKFLFPVKFYKLKKILKNLKLMELKKINWANLIIPNYDHESKILIRKIRNFFIFHLLRIIMNKSSNTNKSKVQNFLRSFERNEMFNFLHKKVPLWQSLSLTKKTKKRRFSNEEIFNLEYIFSSPRFTLQNSSQSPRG